MAAPTTAVRKAVYARDNYRCLMCNTSDMLQWNHRAATGMGGNKQQPGPVEGVVLCGRDNMLIEADRDLMILALAYGIKIRKWANPELVPVFYPHEHAWFRFEGTKRLPVTGPVALELMASVYGGEHMRWYAEVKS